MIALFLMALLSPYPEVTVPFDVHRVEGTPVYYVIGIPGVPGAENQGFMSNAGFVVGEKGVAVFDALGTPSLGKRLIQAIRGITDRPILYVVISHYHADHFYGLQAFKDFTQAEVWAHEDALLYLNSPTARMRLDQRREALFPWVNEDTRLVPPDKTYRDRHSLDLGDVHLDLVHVGPAHAPDDTLMMVREHGVVFSGDILFDGRIPFIGEGVDTDNWLRQLEALSRMEPRPRFVIPGHGMPSADASRAIAFTRGYLEYLRKTMGEAAVDLVPFDEAYASTDWSAYEGLPAFKAAHRRNAYRVYLEMQEETFE